MAASHEELLARSQDASRQVDGPSKDVSTDLSATFRIDKNDVKEAVRASKVMSAVAPDDDLVELDEDVEQSAVPEPISLGDISSQIAEDAAEDDSVAAAAIILPEAPAAAGDLPEKAKKRQGKVMSAMPRNSASILLWLLLLATVGFGAYYYYNNYILEDESSSSSARPTLTKKRVQDTPPPPPPAPSAAIVIEDPVALEVKSTQAGLVAWTVSEGFEVKEGEAIVKMSGFDRFDAEIAKHSRSLESYVAKLAAAEERGNDAKIAQAQGNVDRKKSDIEASTAKRDAFIVNSPSAGSAKPFIGPRSRVGVDQVLATVTGKPKTVVSFTLPEGASSEVGKEHIVNLKSDAKAVYTCLARSVEAQALVLECPSNEALVADTEVELQLN